MKNKNDNKENDSLFKFLTGYVPTEKRESKEDFLTQAFAWLLKEVEGFSEAYIRFLKQNEKKELPSNFEKIELPSKFENIEIITQKELKGCTREDGKEGRLDLLISVNSNTYFICEHKVDSELSEDQIKKYMDNKAEIDPTPTAKFYSVLLTKSVSQHKQPANVSIIWGDIKEFVDNFLQEKSSTEDKYRFLLEQFSFYLSERGLEKAKAINKDELEKYDYTKYKEDKYMVGLIKTLDYFNYRLLDEIQDDSELKRICPNIDKLSDAPYEPIFHRSRWGRRGIDLFADLWDPRGKNKMKKEYDMSKPAWWKPGLFIGFLLDPKDHKLEAEACKCGLDIILTLDGVGKNYNIKKENQKLNSITNVLNIQDSQFDCLTIDKLKNPYRLVVLRRPLIDTLTVDSIFVEDIDKQYELYRKAIIEGLNLLGNACA